MLITRESIIGIEEIIDEVFNIWCTNPGYILTEADLQCILHARLSECVYFSGFHPTNDSGVTAHRVHAEVSWFDADNSLLKYRTDLTILNTSCLSLVNGPEQDHFRLPSKGFYFDGQAIIFEIKLNRGQGRLGANLTEKLKKDRDNLLDIINKFEGCSAQQSVYGFHILFDRSNGNNEDDYNEIFDSVFRERRNINCIYRKIGV